MNLLLVTTFCAALNAASCHDVVTVPPDGMQIALPMVCSKAAQEFASDYIEGRNGQMPHDGERLSRWGCLPSQALKRAV